MEEAPRRGDGGSVLLNPMCVRTCVAPRIHLARLVSVSPWVRGPHAEESSHAFVWFPKPSPCCPPHSSRSPRRPPRFAHLGLRPGVYFDHDLWCRSPVHGLCCSDHAFQDSGQGLHFLECSNPGVFGLLTLTTRISAYGANFSTQ